MKKTKEPLTHLFELSRRAPALDPPALRPGFAARVARASAEAAHSGGGDKAFEPLFRWAIVAFTLLTILVAAVNAPSAAMANFTHAAAYESHVLDLVLLRNE